MGTAERRRKAQRVPLGGFGPDFSLSLQRLNRISLFSSLFQSQQKGDFPQRNESAASPPESSGAPSASAL